MRTILIALLMSLATQTWAQDNKRVSEKLAHEVMLYGEIIHTFNESNSWAHFHVRYKKNLYNCLVGTVSKAFGYCYKVNFKSN